MKDIVSGPRTRSKETENRKAALVAQERKAKRDEKILEKRRQDALRKRPKPVPGGRGDGSLHIAFIKVGQGDCAVMSTPLGRVIMFDCGSKPKEEDDSNDQLIDRVRAAVVDNPKFLKGLDVLDILILTHADADHYNKLKAVLQQDFTINRCYHSDELRAYSANGTSAFLRDNIAGPSAIKKVVKNHDETTLNGVTVAAPDFGNKVDRLGDDGGIVIVDERNCKVTILAAGVNREHNSDHSDEKNRGSIVTLIEANGEKLLLCGDATKSTEHFLMSTASDRLRGRLSNLTLVQAGHHGSNNTSSSQDFVNLVNPKIVVASAGKHIKKDHLPSEEVIERYRKKLTLSSRTKIPTHETFCWKPGGLKSRNHGSVWHEYEVFVTGSEDTIERTFPAPRA
ncbi:MBL fold metallo-hydrolase [Streptomyces sp. NPDC012510]|uniref:ComEC/Rec2 family competence protein n=1 Tax=Streptomyces sp. NPDC012510 TaxID=3364838 RepID=UPI0036EE5892